MDIIVDIDGTLANGSHRQHLLNQIPKDWKTYQTLAHLDTVHQPIVDLVRNLYEYCEATIILCTGRGEQERKLTVAWLHANKIPFHYLYMRAEKDYRADDVIKLELLDKMIEEGLNPSLVLDDRARVVAAWRRRGLTCLQVAEGDF
jgi:hypothetical protein